MKSPRSKEKKVELLWKVSKYSIRLGCLVSDEAEDVS